MTARLIARHLMISGRVQGVAYRASMAHEAQRLGIRGWVRNRQNGDVEAVVQGPPDAVDAIIAWAWRGPSLAMVERVSIDDVDEQNFQRFETRFTA
jgi:acylphosphatase